jgi:protein arginine kinase activator
MAAPFRKCDKCERPANHHDVRIVNGKVSEMHLCEQHAAEAGVAATGHVSIHQLLGNLARAGTATPKGPACPDCGHTFHDYKSTALLGCPSCYRTFASTLEVAIERTQGGGTQHVGRTPPGMNEARERATQLQQLLRELEEAVAAEQYERAARLRDQVKSIRPGPVAGPGAAQ